tara:strand:- start:1397 stop:2926 length:1530 start_codon:yes stop_codon:yes gene_type:complete
MKLLFENWRKYITEEDEEENVLDLSKELNSGFCDYNPLINQYAQYSPDSLAEMLIFVVATQQMRWYDVVPKFPIMMQHIRDNDMLLNPEEAEVNEKGKTVYKIPKAFAQLTLGFRKNAIQSIWQSRESIFSSMSPLFNKYNSAGENSMQKEEAVFEIYLGLIKLPGLGLPKAAFASQLLIGRLGCIDSINLNLYKGLDPEGKLITYDSKGRPTFKTPGISKKTGIIQVTKGGVKLAKEYVEFLKQIAKLTGSTDASISRKLWDSWVELVAIKINKKGDVNVIMPGGEKFVVPNDYSKNFKGAETNPSAAFRKQYVGKITPQDVSRQHFPKQMYEGLQKWSTYVGALLKENVEIAPRGSGMPVGGDVGTAMPGTMAYTMNKFRDFQRDPNDSKKVGKVVIHRNGQVLILISDDGRLDLPGGHIAVNEIPLAGCRREVAEETGLVFHGNEILDLNMRAQDTTFYSAPLKSDDIMLSDEHKDYKLVDENDIESLDLEPTYKKAIFAALEKDR